jgi:hypothetical protein
MTDRVPGPDHLATVTTDEAGQPTSKPQPKVIAATVGAGVGAAASTILFYLIELWSSVDVPEVVEGAGLVLITAGLGFVAGYIKRPSASAS